MKPLKMSPPEPPDPPPEDVDPSIGPPVQPLRWLAGNYGLDFIRRAPCGIIDPEGWRKMRIRNGHGASLRAFDRWVRIHRAMLHRSGCARERGCNRDVLDGVHECEAFCSDLSKREFKSAVSWCLRQLARLERRLP